MKRLNLIVVLIFIFAVFGFGQTNEIFKMAVVDTEAFSNKESGITELIQANLTLDKEFKAQDEEIKVLYDKYKELLDFVRAPERGIELVDISQMPKKKEELEKIEKELKQKTEIAKSQYERRYTEVVKPVLSKINLVIKEFAKQNGYTIIIDKKAMDKGVIIIENPENLDVTEEFIKFYNNYSLTNKPQ